MDTSNTAEPKEMKRKIKVERDHNTKVWTLVSASGFMPDKTSWTEDELKDYLTQNDDINPTLNY